jgi:exopolyphosphatase/guanosine-5'-triphosphate,3'-diphosphate pyrophosphatase
VRIAAIDIGTNSIHMVVAQARGGTTFDVVDREREVVQIGRGSFSRGRLRRDAIRRTVEALGRFVRLARRHQVDKIVCTATAAVREARNGGDFLQAARIACGVAPRVIPSDEEGRLIYLGVRSALQLGEAPSLIVDIGGGSMQLVVGNRERCIHTGSAPLGALRLTELLLPSDPPSRNDLARLRRHIRRQLKLLLKTLPPPAPEQIYGSSGTIHALAQAACWAESGVDLEQVNGYELGTEALGRLAERLVGMSQNEREHLHGIDATRAEIVVPGALVLHALLVALELEHITVSDFGVREGLVTDYLAHHAREISELESVEELRLRSVYALLAKFHADGAHPRHVARLTLELFDALRKAHGLGADARDLLHFAALLHDIGSAVGYDGHQEHSAYVIKNGNLRGLTAEDVGIVALVARYHGNARPRKRDPDYRALDRPHRRTVRWLAALLRIAEALERSHYQLIRSLRVVKRGGRYSIRVSARREAHLELWAARRRTGLLARLLDADVSVVLEGAAARPAKAARAAVRARRESPTPVRARSARKRPPGRSRRPGVPAPPTVAAAARAGAAAARSPERRQAPVVRLAVPKG